MELKLVRNIFILKLFNFYTKKIKWNEFETNVQKIIYL